MKAQIKIKIISSNSSAELMLFLKLENEKIYWHTKSLIETRWIPNRTDLDNFYSEVIYFVSDINNIKQAGENFMREILQEKANKLVFISKEVQAKALLKTLKEPIEIEIVEAK